MANEIIRGLRAGTARGISGLRTRGLHPCQGPRLKQSQVQSLSSKLQSGQEFITPHSPATDGQDGSANQNANGAVCLHHRFSPPATPGALSATGSASITTGDVTSAGHELASLNESSRPNLLGASNGECGTFRGKRRLRCDA